MVARKYHLQRLLIPASICLGLFLLATPFVAGSESAPSGSEERLQELLTERYDVLKQMYAALQLQLEHGRLDPVEWRRATFALHHAEAELCTTDAERVQVYEKLVQDIQKQENLAVRREAAGRIPQGELAEARFATLEAQIDLERARLGQLTFK